MWEDRTHPIRRTTVSEAAEILGISAEAVRGRIRRGTLRVEREGGRVYVLLEKAPEDRTTADQSRTTDDRPGDRTDLLIAELQDRVRSLEEANRENRRIIAALTSRIPAIEAPSEARESPERPSPSGELGELREELDTERTRREMAESTLHEGMAEEQHRREEAERERDELRQELHALREPRESPQTVEEELERAEPHAAAGEAQEGAQRRSWWRRIIGG
jgi:chromosome segregation ATPase